LPLLCCAETKVIDSRLVADGTQVRRRRELVLFGKNVLLPLKWLELVMPTHRSNRGGSRENPFNEGQNWRAACSEHSIKTPGQYRAKIRKCISRLKSGVQPTGEREVDSQFSRKSDYGCP